MAINVAQHIKELLYDDHMVIIPDLGMISAEYVPAVTNHKESTIAPPHYKYVFEEKIKESDGVLIEILVKNHSISKTQAELLLKSYSKQIITNIKEGKKIVLAGIGRLYSNRIGEIVLEKNDSTVDPYSHHLPVIQLKGLSSGNRIGNEAKKTFVPNPIVAPKVVESKPIVSKIKESKPLEKVSGVASSSAKTITGTGSKVVEATAAVGSAAVAGVSGNKQEKKKSFSKLLLGLALISFLLVLFSGIYFLSDSESNFWDKFNFGSSNSTSIVTDTDGLEDDNATDGKTSGTDVANNSEGKGTKGNSNVSSEENTTATQGPNLATTSNCVIIVGMFSEQANVDKLIGKIESQGFKAYTKQRSRGTQLGIYTDCSNTNTVLDYAKNNIEKGSFLKRL